MFPKVLSILLFLYVGNAASAAVQTKIIGGYPTSITYRPYQVVLQTAINPTCGGSLITEKCVLTAAHCVKRPSSKRLTIRGGITKLSDKSVDQTVSKIISHEKFNPETYENDIAIIQLQGRLQGANIKTIKVTKSSPKAGQAVEVAGFGYMEENAMDFAPNLMAVNLTIVDQEKCKKLYEKENFITEGMMCAEGSGEGIKDTCNGDSGGALIARSVNKPGTIEQVGIVSYGVGCGNPLFPGVYTNLNFYGQWIDKVVKENC